MRKSILPILCLPMAVLGLAGCALTSGTEARSEIRLSANTDDLPTRMTAEISHGTVTVVDDKGAYVKGKLEYQNGDGDWVGLPGQTVRLRFTEQGAGSFSTHAVETTTKSDGAFGSLVPMPASGKWTATYNDPASGPVQDGYARADAETAQIRAYYRTTISGLTAAPHPVGKGATLTIRGHVHRLAADGSLRPVSGGSLTVWFSADGTYESLADHTPSDLRTDATGAFTVSVKAVRDGYWGIHYEAMPRIEPTRDLVSKAMTGPVDVRYRTSVSSFNAAPEPVRKGKTLTVSGVLKRSVDGSTSKGWSGQAVHVYYRPKGSTVWTYAGTAKTTSTGKFVKGFKAAKDATWKAVYKGDVGHLRAESTTDYVDVR